MHTIIVQRVVDRLSGFDTILQDQALGLVNRTLAGDKGRQITLLPYFVKKSLGKFGKGIPESVLMKLGSASLLGWIAYTIYDDFLDGEGKPNTLPLANIALRSLTGMFTSVVEDCSEFTLFFHAVMDAMDEANNWEITHCRVDVSSGSLSLKDIPIPDYEKYEWLAKRSLGHAIAPCAILYSLGYTHESEEVKHLLSFFKHYLIARQLNDDAHDFTFDLHNGHINAVGANLLTSVKAQGNKKAMSLSELLPIMNELFWKEEVVTFCNDIFTHTRLARKALKKIRIIREPQIYEKMLLSVESPAKKALTEHKKAMQFLAQYQSP